MNNIKKLKLKGTKTTKEIANLIGIPQTDLIRYENNSKVCPLDVAQKLANYFKVSVSQVLGEHSNETSFENSFDVETTPKYINNIDRLIKENKLSYRKLASLVNMNHGFVSRLANGEATPTENTALKLAKYFNVSIDYILGKTDNPDITFIPIKKMLADAIANCTKKHISVVIKLSDLPEADVDKVDLFVDALKEHNKEESIHVQFKMSDIE